MRSRIGKDAASHVQFQYTRNRTDYFMVQFLLKFKKMEKVKPKRPESTHTHPEVADKHPLYSCGGKTPPEIDVNDCGA